MSWHDAKSAAEKWCAHNLDGADLRGALVQLVDFGSDADCRLFYVDRDLGFHRMLTRAIARQARKSGAKVQYATLRAADYTGVDDQRSRSAFAESCHRVLR